MTKRKKHRKRLRLLKKQYKKTVREQCIRDFFLLSKQDIGKDSLFVPPLTNTDTLFVKREDSEKFGMTLSDDDIYFQNGYASGAAILFNLIRLSEDRFIRASYINPAMFCFRQYLELIMKDSLLRFRLFRKTANRGECCIEGHDLMTLWRDLVTYLDVAKDDDVVHCVENLLNELNSVDKGGTLFRYNDFLTKNICGGEQQKPLIDVDILYTRMLQLYRFFEGVNELSRNTNV